MRNIIRSNHNEHQQEKETKQHDRLSIQGLDLSSSSTYSSSSCSFISVNSDLKQQYNNKGHHFFHHRSSVSSSSGSPMLFDESGSVRQARKEKILRFSSSR